MRWLAGRHPSLPGANSPTAHRLRPYGYLFNELGRNIRITRTETSVEYKKGGAIVVAENDVRGRKPPQLNVRQVTDLLKISKEENVKVQAVSSYRTDSKAHMYWNAVDVNIYSKDGKVNSSKQVADILFNSVHLQEWHVTPMVEIVLMVITSHMEMAIMVYLKGEEKKQVWKHIRDY